ncbi:hypothetical protein M409DRAFT_29134 [Zasmidium cellare ATCC 36951]|uniref:Uncharacterized protein n=1 Tax=Zasmidium cellare ATCC 36951 TaxID=1080233 RepID=A0A6A6C0D4_ZASCE|nr:uncharacterized protein M409DRAFT_29134 [Zasmidium cellare ATCC 36951]KAF2160514.1 hypothetical protein M409DRAFT_29134 [Zasmidium cellare ATCC 36951]
MTSNSQAAAMEQHRAEIEARTANGDGCEQIAAALRASGFQTSAKTISRYRVSWGLRKRAAGTLGRKYPDRKRKSTAPGELTKAAKAKAQLERKADITERTKQGQTAEEIANALEAQGVDFKGGASTVWRLQTYWGLVPYDTDRARGKGMYNKKRPVPPEKRRGPRSKAPRDQQEGSGEPPNPGEVLHYPTNCAHGPQKRIAPNRTATQTDDSINVEDDSQLRGNSAGTDSFMTMNVDPASASNSNDQVVTNAAELMQAELLIDLATSTLAAAHRVKELYLAQQMQRPASDSSSGLPPTPDDIATAKTKVRQAAAVMHDMALPNVAG